jgi:hypothetical protein
VVIHNLDINWACICPAETDPPLIVYPNAVLPNPIALQRLKSIPGWHPKFIQCHHRIKDRQLPPRGSDDGGVQLRYPFALPQLFSGAVAEGADHSSSLTHGVINVKG